MTAAGLGQEEGHAAGQRQGGRRLDRGVGELSSAGRYGWSWSGAYGWARGPGSLARYISGERECCSGAAVVGRQGLACLAGNEGWGLG